MPIINQAFGSLDSQFKPIVLQILTKLEEKGHHPIVVEGRRTLAQQQEKVRQGVSQTMKSYHLSGLAADICDSTEMWDKGLVRPFWWDLYQVATSVVVTNGHLRYGIIWDHPEREAIYKKALDDLLAGNFKPYTNKAGKLITAQQQADARINWFADVAHIELRV